MTRAITTDNYTETCSELICSFAAALIADRMDLEDQDVTCTSAFQLAAECGWDWEADKDFTTWALKALVEESLVAGLQKALAAVRSQYEDFIANSTHKGS